MGAEQSSESNKSSNSIKKTKKVVKKDTTKKPVVEKKVVKKPVVEKKVKKPVVEKKVVKKPVKGGYYLPNNINNDQIIINAEELNNEYIGYILRCPGIQESGQISIIEHYFDGEENQMLVHVEFVEGTSYQNTVFLNLHYDEECYLEQVNNNLDQINESIQINAGELNDEYIGYLLECPNIQESGQISIIEHYFDDEEKQMLVHVEFVEGTTQQNTAFLNLPYDEVCYLYIE